MTRPRPAFGTAHCAPFGVSCAAARYARLRCASPEGSAAGRRKHIYRKQFTPAPNLCEFRKLLCPIQAGLDIELCRRPVFIEQNCISSFLTMGFPTAEEARITCAIVDAAAKVRDLTSNTWVRAKARPSPPASAPTASPSALRTARVKVRTRCSSGFTRSRFELLSAAISHYQELTLLLHFRPSTSQ